MRTICVTAIQLKDNKRVRETRTVNEQRILISQLSSSETTVLDEVSIRGKVFAKPVALDHCAMGGFVGGFQTMSGARKNLGAGE